MAEAKKPTLEEIRKLIGKKKDDVLEIDKSMLRAFNQCIGESDPKWEKTAHPGLLTAAMLSGGVLILGVPYPYKRGVAAGADWEYLKPIKVGDVITTTHEFADIQDKSSEKGPRALMIFKSTHKNQKGEVVAISTNTVMSY